MAAGNATIGALRVTLAADTADLDKGLKSSQLAIAAFAGAIGGAMGKVADQIVGALKSIPDTFTQIIDDMDKLGKESQKLGIPVEELSKLAVAADSTNIAFGDLSKSMVKFATSITSAIKDPTSAAAQEFKKLGVSLSDLKNNSPDQIFAKTAEGFSKFADGAGKSAGAVVLFGKAGADLIPLLNQGASGLQDAKDKAEEFGLAVSAGSVKAASEFNDSLKDLSLLTKGVFKQALDAVLPTLAAIADNMVETKKNSGLLSFAITALTDVLKAAVTTFVIANAVIDSAAQTWGALFGAISAAIKGDFSAAFDRVKKGTLSIADTANSAKKTIDDLWSGQAVAANEAAAATENASKSTKNYNENVTVAKNAVDGFIASQQKGLATRQAEIATFGQLAGVQAAMKIQLDAEAIAKSNNITITATQLAQIEQLKTAYGDAATKLQGLQVTQANLTPAQALIKQQTELKALLDAGAISADTYGRAMRTASENAKNSWDIAGASIAGSFKDIAGAFSKNNKSMLVAAQIFGAIQATISMFTGAAKALELPFPANLAAMAVVLAKGAALVASIKSQQIPSAATGLSTVVPGGFGGGDSKLFQALVEPGEQIDVIPGSQRGGIGGGGGRAVVELRGLQDKRYSLDEVKQIMKGIGDAMKFGYKFENA